jgi:hypothetical protein
VQVIVDVIFHKEVPMNMDEIQIQKQLQEQEQ